MGPAQGSWQLGVGKPFTLSTPFGAGLPPNNYWRDARPEAVGRCRVDLPIDAPLPDDLEERGWTVVDRSRDRARWVDVVVLEGNTLPRHVAGEYMTEWRSFDDLREAVARALAAAFSPPMPEDETAQLGTFGLQTTGTWTGAATTTTSAWWPATSTAGNTSGR